MDERIEQTLQEIKKINEKTDKMAEKIDRTLDRMEKADRKYDSTIGALGSRWGLYSEASFRNALASCLQESFGVEVLNMIMILMVSFLADQIKWKLM